MVTFPSRGEYSFLGLEKIRVEDADVVIFPVPYDSTTSYRPGTRFGPRAIILASNELESFDLESKKDITKIVKICTLQELEPDVNSPQATIQLVRRVVEHILKANKFPIILGGEHTVALGGIEAATKFFRDLTIVCLDAHADLRNFYQNSKYSHACVMRRAFEYCQNILLIGTRSMCEEEYNFVKENNLKIFPKIGDVDEIVDECKENVYLTIDLDVLDPSILPGVGTPVPGGLTWGEVLNLLRELFKKKKVIATDIVELLPIPNETVSEDLAATLVFKLITYKFVKV